MYIYNEFLCSKQAGLTTGSYGGNMVSLPSQYYYHPLAETQDGNNTVAALYLKLLLTNSRFARREELLDNNLSK